MAQARLIVEQALRILLLKGGAMRNPDHTWLLLLKNFPTLKQEETDS
jgi:hypothetical protein